MLCVQSRQRFERLDEVLIQIAAEVRRVVGVHSHAQARIEQGREVVVGERVEHAQLHVRQRADGERHLVAREALHQCRVFDAANAMIDALDLQHVERIADVLRRTLFAGMRYAGVTLRADFALDADAMEGAIARERPALVYLAYPNNPTGNLFATAAMERVLRAAPGLVVVDEAYHAFADASFLPRLSEFPNLLVLRTVSKIGMAGLRLGYAVAAPEWIAEFDKVRQPYNLNAMTQAIAPVLLSERDLLA